MKKKPLILAVCGVKNSGKTTLIQKLIPLLQNQGLKVAAVKHDGHDFEPDVPGTDSHSFWKAGAVGTAIFSDSKYMVIRKEKMSYEQIGELFPEADLILAEGLKSTPCPKLEIVRQGISQELSCCQEGLLGILTDFSFAYFDSEKNPSAVPVLSLNDPEKIADKILDFCFARRSLSMVVLAGGLSRRMGQEKAELNYAETSFLNYQLKKGQLLGIEERLISGYRGALVKSFQEEILIPDRIPNAGPLGGLEACFQASIRPYALVLPVDMPTVTISLLASLISGFRRYIKEECSAGKRPDIMILCHGGKEEPLAAIYPTELAALAREQILSKDRSVMGFMKAAGYRTLDVPDLKDAFVNINDPGQYQKLKNIHVF